MVGKTKKKLKGEQQEPKGEEQELNAKKEQKRS